MKLLYCWLILTSLSSCQLLMRKYLDIDRVGVYEKRSDVILLLKERREEFVHSNSLVFRTNAYVHNSPDTNNLLTPTLLIFDSLGQRRVIQSNSKYCSIDDISKITSDTINIYSLPIADSIWPMTFNEFVQSVVDSSGEIPNELFAKKASSYFVFGFSTFSARRNLKEYKEFSYNLPSDSHLILINRDIICEDNLDANTLYKEYCLQFQEKRKALTE